MHIVLMYTGLLHTNAIVEVKCLFKVHNTGLSLEEAVKKDPRTCLYFNLEGKLALKRSHHYYYQIQGQLNISRRTLCFFIVYVNDFSPLFVQVISKDEEFWRNVMLPKLTKFYIYCVLPELIYRKHLKG